jgi:hypothetical protein
MPNSLKSNSEKYEKKLKEKNERLDKLEIELLHKEKITEIKRKLLADQEFEIEKKEKELSELKSKSTMKRVLLNR